MTMVDPRGTTNALAEGYSMLQGIQQDRARRMAGNALAGGDTQGAMSALGGVGDLQSIQALQDREIKDAERLREREEEDRKEAMGFLTQGATALLQAPPDQRQQLYMEVLRPTLEQMGYDPQILMQLDQADKSDANLRSLIVAAGGEVQSPYANDVTVGRARIRPDRYTGEYAPVYEAPVDPLDQAYRQAQIDALRAQEEQRMAATARSRRPPGGGGSGRGGSGGGSSGRPAPPQGSGRPWERFR